MLVVTIFKISITVLSTYLSLKLVSVMQFLWNFPVQNKQVKTWSRQPWRTPWKRSVKLILKSQDPETENSA